MNVMIDAHTITEGTVVRGCSSEVNWVTEGWASVLWEKRIPWEKAQLVEWSREQSASGWIVSGVKGLCLGKQAGRGVQAILHALEYLFS